MNNTAMEPTTERFAPYTFEILPEHTLILDNDTGILTDLHNCEIIEQQLLSPSEFTVVQALFNEHPYYCPYEVVLSAMTGKSVEVCRDRVYQGMEENALDVVMRPVRNLLGRCRMKLKPFGLQIRSMVHEGYMLVPVKERVHHV